MEAREEASEGDNVCTGKIWLTGTQKGEHIQCKYLDENISENHKIKTKQIC